MDSLLVTGATGFVGRNIVLRARGEGVRVLAPARNPKKLAACLAEDGIPATAVAALGTEPETWGAVAPTHAVLGAGVLFARDRNAYFGVNVDWTLRVLRALPENCRVVILSSQSAGGPTPRGRAARSESDPDSPLTWYGESKLAMEAAVLEEFSGRPITLLRPPMILGARDSATLPLFKMARGMLRTKPGLKEKWFSYLGVGDVVDAVFAAFGCGGAGPFYIGSEQPISDLDLIASAARASGGRGLTVPVPLPLVQILSALVDAVPALRESTPSLTRDRAKEIWPDRWIVDSSAFRAAAGWTPSITLDDALDDAFGHYRKTGQI